MEFPGAARRLLAFMMTESHELTHEMVNEALAAVRKHRLEPNSVASLFVAHEIGPALELTNALARDPEAGPARVLWTPGPGLAAFSRALAANKALWAPGFETRVGFYRTLELPETRDPRFHDYFRARMQQAAEASGFSKRTAQALAGAMGEIEGNIYEHSERHRSGIVAFQSGPGVFTFVIADTGIGVLPSLRQSSKFASLCDHGHALELVLKDGVSRFSNLDPARGMGFRELFHGLASLRGRLRFASGDHALLMEGQSPSLASYRLVQKESCPGFFVAVTCHAPLRRMT